jgi:putative ABC transport system ATP-binding protein
VADPILAIENLQVTFGEGTRGEVRALDGLSLRVDRRDFVLVLGTNGSGKSTMLGAIAGAVRPAQGRIRIAGVEVTGWPAHRRASLVGRVFQNPYQASAADLTLAEHLALASRRGARSTLARALTPERREQFRAAVKQLDLGLEHRLDARMGTLSGGQRQAMTLLMATLGGPQLLLLDEHTAALDPRSEEQVLRLTAELVERHRLTAIMVTHSVEHATALGNRVILMHRGRIVEDYEGSTKRRLRVPDLLDRFADIRNTELLDDSAADLLRRMYV